MIGICLGEARLQQAFQILKRTKHFGINTMYSLFSQIYKIYISSLLFSFSFFSIQLSLQFRVLPSGRRSGGRRHAGGGAGGSGSSVLVPLHVQGQVVRAGEAAVAHAALEGLGPRVLAVVPGQLVRAREPPVAAFPGALVRLLTCAKGPRGGGEGVARNTDTGSAAC